MAAVIGCGLLCLAGALLWLPYHLIDLNFLVLFCFTIGLGSRISVQIPKFKSHIGVSDTFIFLALLMYGGEVAIVLSAVEAFLLVVAILQQKADGLLQYRGGRDLDHLCLPDTDEFPAFTPSNTFTAIPTICKLLLLHFQRLPSRSFSQTHRLHRYTIR